MRLQIAEYRPDFDIKKRGLTKSPRWMLGTAVAAGLHDQQIVRTENHAGLNRRHGDRRSLGSIGAVVERLVGGIEVEFGTESRELIVAAGFEQRRHVHARGQAAAEPARGDRDV